MLPFPDCGEPLGLYPIVDNSTWLEKLLPCGVKTIQLRVKNSPELVLEDEIQKSVWLSQRYQARLFINDHWQLAIKQKAYGVHLGQEDLTTANLQKIHQAGLRLGVSTHSYEELVRAYRCKPSYIAFGPIFETHTKRMLFAPQGVARLKQWKQTLKRYPLVAIGGIHEENFSDVLATGVDGIAMISAITQAKDPEQMTQLFLKKMKLCP